ncbi:MAG: glycoside hydrolase family 92 protein, partial [Bifidobacteriaceae bacterium]|nr:glycoside hydrolase family 92 protein [Bifidobacteriaceae bacterium]
MAHVDLKRLVGLVGAGALSLGIVQGLPLTASAADPPIPGGTWATSFEASDPAPTVSAYVDPVNVAGRKYTAGDLGGFYDISAVLAHAGLTGGERAELALDGDTSTKWYSSGGAPRWITIPLTAPKTVAKYTIVGANDDTSYAARFPRTWDFAGSNDPLCKITPNSVPWDVLDHQEGLPAATSNHQVRTFTLADEAQGDYLCYIVTNLAGSSGSALQLSEIQLNDGSTVPPPPEPPVATVGNGPTSGYNIKTGMGWTGSQAFNIAGSHIVDGDATVAYTLYQGLNVPIGSETEFSYVLIPKLYPTDLSYPSQFTAVDFEYVDPDDPGTLHRLSDSDLVDQYGFGVSARDQGAAKKMWSNHWNRNAVDLSPLAGMTVTKVILVYDNPTGDENTLYEVWVDDIAFKDATPIDDSSLVNYVDTRRGTLSSGSFSRGLNFPAAAVPNGFNFYTPATDLNGTGSMYAYAASNNADNRPTLRALRISHAPSNWMGDYLYTNIFGNVAAAANTQYRASSADRALSFSHDNEIARPDLYQVQFDNGMTASIAPESHGAVFKFDYPETADFGSILFDNGNSTTSATSDSGGSFTVNQVNGEVTGWDGSNYGGWTAGGGRLYIYAKFSEPVVGTGSGAGRGLSKYANFDLSGTNTVEARVATSFISVDQAKKNYELELQGRTFDEVQEAAEASWNDRLKVIDMSETDTNDIHKVMVYSDLYRLNLYPNARHENVGDNATPEWKYASPVTYPAQTTGTTGATTTQTNQQVRSGKMYVNNGFWDTYRTAWPMYAMLYPELSSELVDGFAEQYRAGGWIARWSSPGYADLMTGTSSDSAFAEAYNIGVMDAETALDIWFAAERNATSA